MKDFDKAKPSDKDIQNLKVENQTLCDQISILKLKCKTFESETKNSMERFSCLKHLVKRAWCGDHEASKHVANIVGVAPPLFIYRHDDEEVVAFPKSRAINNWASLSASLLERYYKQREDVMFLKKRQFLIEREHFLDSQLDGYINEIPRDHPVDKGLDLIYAVNKSKPLVEVLHHTSRPTSPWKSRPSFKKMNDQKSQARMMVSPVQSMMTYGESGDAELQIDSNNNILPIDSFNIQNENPNEVSPPTTCTPTSPAKLPSSRTRPSSAYRPATAGPSINTREKSNPTVKTERSRPGSASTSRTSQKRSTKSAMGRLKRDSKNVKAASQKVGNHTKQRPFSAQCVGVKYFTASLHDVIEPCKSASIERQRQLDVVEKRLQKTTQLLQKKLSINPLSFV